MFQEVEARAQRAAMMGDSIALKEARQQASRLSTAARSFENLGPKEQGIAHETMEILRRLRREHPALRQYDAYDLTSTVVLRSFSGLPPERVAMDVVAMAGIDGSADSLARAANIMRLSSRSG